jgi:hypothetical protein
LTLGMRMEAELQIPFICVESIWLTLFQEKIVEGAAYEAEGQRRVVEGVRKALRENEQVVLESTGTALWFPHFLESLRAVADVELIRVSAPEEVCLARVRRRDSTKHIAVSDDQVKEINRHAQAVVMPWATVLDHLTPSDADAFIASWRRRGRSRNV